MTQFQKTTYVVQMQPSLLKWQASGREKMNLEIVCRMCQRGEPRVITRHHVVPQSWFRDYQFVTITSEGRRNMATFLIRDCNANIIPLCIQCHAAVEAPSDDSARRMLRKVMGGNEVAFAISLMGEEWFDMRYPAKGSPKTVAHKSMPHVVRRLPIHSTPPTPSDIEDAFFGALSKGSKRKQQELASAYARR